MRVPERLRDESGAMLIFIALMLIAFLAVFAIAVDVGHWLNARAEAQRAADAAALAGAGMFMYLEGDPERPVNIVTGADESARSFAAQNYIGQSMIDPASLSNDANPPVYCTEGTQVDVCVNTGLQRVDVVVRGSTSALFSRLLGFLSLDVQAQAAARVFDAGAAKCVKPFAIPDMWQEGSGDLNGNRIWDWDIGLGCNGNECPQREIWSFDPADDTYDRATTGYASGFRNNQQDESKMGPFENDFGRRIPIKIQGGSGNQNVESHFYLWAMPGSERGTTAIVQNILGCIPEAQIGTTVDSITPEPGNAGQPVADAIQQLIEMDPHARWNDDTGQVEYGGMDSPYASNWRNSPRVFTVAVFHPSGMRTGRNDRGLEFVDFMQVFLEDPLLEYPHLKKNDRPITARMIGYVSGNTAPQTGTTTKVLQLVK